MNLLEFSQLVSSKSMNNELLSKEVALYDVILACFDIKSIKTISILKNNKFEIELSDNDESHSLHELKDTLNNQIIPGAFQPLYKISMSYSKNVVWFDLMDI